MYVNLKGPFPGGEKKGIKGWLVLFEGTRQSGQKHQNINKREKDQKGKLPTGSAIGGGTPKGLGKNNCSKCSQGEEF